MGWLSTVMKVVGVVAAVASGGILAGAVIALASFAGGSVGKFFQSGWGKALTYAVAAESAYAGLSAGGAQAAEQSSTTSGFLDNFVSGAKSFVSALAHPIDTAESLFGAGSTSDLSAGAAGATGNLTANASETAAQATSDTAAAVGETGGAAAQASAATTPVNELASTSDAASGTTTTFGDAADQAASPGAAAAASPGTPAAAEQAASGAGGSGATSGAGGASQIQAQSSPGVFMGNSSSNASGGGGGLLSRAVKFATTPGGGQMIGQIVQGIGNGMAQNSLIQKEIAAQNWANLQWRNPQLTQQVQAAAARPITVPSGYLSRAQAVSNLMNGSPTTGPIMGPQPTAGGGPGPGGAGTPMPPSPVRAGGT